MSFKPAFLNWGLNMLLYYALFKANQQDSIAKEVFKSLDGAPPWYVLKLRDNIILGIVLILSTLIHLATQYYRRPIVLNVTQNNASNGGNAYTHYYYGKYN